MDIRADSRSGNKMWLVAQEIIIRKIVGNKKKLLIKHGTSPGAGPIKRTNNCTKSKREFISRTIKPHPFHGLRLEIGKT